MTLISIAMTRLTSVFTKGAAMGNDDMTQRFMQELGIGNGPTVSAPLVYEPTKGPISDGGKTARIISFIGSIPQSGVFPS
jgi:hypothetical protein